MSSIPRDPSTGLLALLPSLVYGPVRSRRLGSSLGLNILPLAAKVCTFNCVYCQYGWSGRHKVADLRWPTPQELADALTDALLRAGSTLPDRLTLAGHGEPTLHPNFGEVIAAVRAVRDRHAPAARIALLSNGTCAHLPAVRRALLDIDDRFMKLDAGDQATLRRVNGSAHPHATLVEALRTLPGITLQSMFVADPRERCGNATPEAADAWLDTVRRIRPAGVHLYTIARQPALARLQPVPREYLQSLATRLETWCIPAEVFD
jgi:wyosine [tRNA(Phe)-imidazoG37] synthetase (radical SAM superfamily)